MPLSENHETTVPTVNATNRRLFPVVPALTLALTFFAHATLAHAGIIQNSQEPSDQKAPLAAVEKNKISEFDEFLHKIGPQGKYLVYVKQRVDRLQKAMQEIQDTLQYSETERKLRLNPYVQALEEQKAVLELYKQAQQLFQNGQAEAATKRIQSFNIDQSTKVPKPKSMRSSDRRKNIPPHEEYRGPFRAVNAIKKYP